MTLMKYCNMCFQNCYRKRSVKTKLSHIFLDLVIKLGPLNPATYQYEYAVVTDANKASLYIYARNVAKFQETYQKEVLKFCQDYGFNSYYNEPRKTPQPVSCWYNRADANKTTPVELPLKAKEEDNFHYIAEALESFRGHRFCPRKAD